MRLTGEIRISAELLILLIISLSLIIVFQCRFSTSTMNIQYLENSLPTSIPSDSITFENLPRELPLCDTMAPKAIVDNIISAGISSRENILSPKKIKI